MKPDMCHTEAELRLMVFSTALGWCGILGARTDAGPVVHRLWIGHSRAAQVQQIATQWSSDSTRADDWSPDLRRRIEAYCDGAPDGFSDVLIETGRVTAFRERVLKQVRRIGFGQTRTYGEIAELAGSPRAARAVGNTMACNRVPLIVPCHRVLASGGRLGGFSAPTGVQLKRRLLELECCAVPDR